MNQIANAAVKNAKSLLTVGTLMLANSMLSSIIRTNTTEFWLDLSKNARYIKNSIRERRAVS